MAGIEGMQRPTADDVRMAAERIRGFAVETPLLENADLNAQLGGRLFIKPETLQRTGSFKFRGAFNCLSRIPAERKPVGVVSFSSGNHAQGVAAAAQILSMPATIVMPSDAPRIKVARTRGYGTEVVFYDRKTESREAIAGEIAERTGAMVVPSFDHPDIIAGQGTAGMEIVAQARAAGVEALDAVVICCGGGGLTAGCALAIKDASPKTEVYISEPAGFDDTRRSLEAGERLAVEPGAESFCDALLAPMPGELTFAINRRLVTGGFAVTDAEVAHAMATAFAELKLVVEPGGAVALAAVLAGKLPIKGRNVAVVCSGGNVDPDTFRAAIGDGE